MGSETVMEDLKMRAVRGGVAKIWAQAAFFFLRIGSLMILARLLGPRDFGLVGMVTAVTGVLSLFKDAGLSTATVQRVNVTDDQISNLFWVNILIGVILGVFSLAIAPVLVGLYHEPRLSSVTAALATSFLLNAAGVQHTAILQRQMRFTALAIVDTLSSLVSSAVGVGMALAGCGYWSLVGMSITAPAISTLSVWLITSWIPGLPRRHVGVRSMLNFGGTVTLNGLVVYLAYNLDKVLLGRYRGADVLGVYGRAYQLINIPTDSLNSAVGVVAFSALSRLQEDPRRFKSYFLKGYSLVLTLTLPVTLASALFANEIIVVLLGPTWKDAATILRLLTPTILAFGLINPLGWMLYSIGLVGRSLKIALVLAPLVISSYVLGLPHGPNGVAFAFSAVMTLWIIPHIVWCTYKTNISPNDVFQTLKQPFFSAIVAAILTLGVKSFSHHLPVLLQLVIGIGILFGTYSWMLLYIMGKKAFYLDLLRGLRKR